MQNMIFIINQYSTTGVYMKVILWKIGQIYVSNNYCALSFHISVIIASNKKQITSLQTSTIVDLISKLIISFH